MSIAAAEVAISLVDHMGVTEATPPSGHPAVLFSEFEVSGHLGSGRVPSFLRSRHHIVLVA